MPLASGSQFLEIVQLAELGHCERLSRSFVRNGSCASVKSALQRSRESIQIILVGVPLAATASWDVRIRICESVMNIIVAETEALYDIPMTAISVNVEVARRVGMFLGSPMSCV